LARSALRGRFRSAQKPSTNGRPVRRMNSASRGLRPTVGLRRPGGGFFASAEADAWRGAPLKPISIGTKAFGRRSPAPTEKRLRRRNAWRGAQKSHFGQRSACASADRKAGRFQSFGAVGVRIRLQTRPARPQRVPLARKVEGRFQSAQKPSADGWPVLTAFASGGRRLARSAEIGTEAFGQRSACADRKAFPASAERLARSPREAEAFGRRSACADRKAFPASAEADAWRARADFNLRPMVGLCRPGEGSQWRAQNRPKAFGQWSACAPNEFGRAFVACADRETPGAER
jgi:hypothetical protein